MKPSTNFHVNGDSVARIAKTFGIDAGEAFITYTRFLNNNIYIPEDRETAREMFIVELEHYRREDNLKKVRQYINNYSITSFYHITHIRNLISILESGLLARNEIDSSRYYDISDQQIQNKRHVKKANHLQEKSLHDFVPLFFAIRPPMLYSIRDCQDELLYLHIRPEIISHPFIMFTDGNATSKKTKQFTNLDDLELIDWALLRKSYWGASDPAIHRENKRKRSAEILIPTRVDPSMIFMISSKTEEIRRIVSATVIAKNMEIDVRNNPGLFCN